MCLLIQQAFTALLGDPGCVESLSSRRFQPNIWNLHQILPEKNGQEKALKLKGWKIWLPCRKSCHEALWINTRRCSKAGYSKERHFWSASKYQGPTPSTATFLLRALTQFTFHTSVSSVGEMRQTVFPASWGWLRDDRRSQQWRPTTLLPCSVDRNFTHC